MRIHDPISLTLLNSYLIIFYFDGCSDWPDSGHGSYGDDSQTIQRFIISHMLYIK